jgi:SNF2 family DNA or RNA helicase
MLVEEQIQARQERGRQAIQKITARPPHGPYGDYAVRSASGKSYRVALRGPGLFDNYCSCPDFAGNTLGTCKHIESLLQRLRRRRRSALGQQDYQRRRASLSLRYGETIDVRLRMPNGASAELQRVAASYFDSSGILPGKHYKEFGKLLDELRRVDESAVVYSDVIEFVDRINEFEEGLDFERRQLRKMEAGKLPLDRLLKQPLFPYQMRGALFAACRGRVVLADDMGLGKTIQTIAAIELLRQRRGIERVLVVAPTSVKYQWQTEIEKFCDLSVQVIDGLHPRRKKLYERPAFFNLINYELVLKDLERIQALGADVIVLDEAQRIRNWATATARRVKQLKSRYAIVLTGTPLENKLEELYSVVEFVDGRLLGPAFRFLKEHVDRTEKGKLLGYRKLGEVRRRLEPILLRRTRSEVLRELPKRTDQIFRMPMTKQQAEPYWEQNDILAKLMHKWERQGWLSEMDLRRITCCIQNMRMLCNSTFLFDKETNVSPKLDEFREIIRELAIEEGRKVVVFSEYERMTWLAGEVLKKLKIDFVSLHGLVPARKRGALIKRFREDPDCKVFFSTDAGGVGLNLQAATAVINFEPPWNPARLEQRIGRVHRMGQLHPVQVIHMLTEKSIEERVWETMRLKMALFAGVFESGDDEISFEKLGRKSMLETLKEVFAERTEPADDRAPGQEAKDSPIAVEPAAEPPAPPSAASPATPPSPLPVPPPGAPPAPAAELTQAMSGLIEAGMRFLEAISFVATGPESAPTPAGRLNGPPKDFVSDIIRTDSETGVPMLTIPLPETVTTERVANAIGSFLRTFQARG